MPQKTCTTSIELERETALSMKQWAEEEGRSTRRHVAVLMRKLVHLKKSQPDELRRLGLADRSAATTN